MSSTIVKYEERYGKYRCHKKTRDDNGVHIYIFPEIKANIAYQGMLIMIINLGLYNKR